MSTNKKRKTCLKCGGTGWQKRTHHQQCNKCNDINEKCYLCENANRTLWESCNNCWGSGTVCKKKVIRNTI